MLCLYIYLNMSFYIIKIIWSSLFDFTYIYFFFTLLLDFKKIFESCLQVGIQGDVYFYTYFSLAIEEFSCNS